MATPKYPVPQTSSPYGLQWAVKQALASARLEGFTPDADFELRLAQWMAGEISDAEYLEWAARSSAEYAARVRAEGGAGGNRKP